MCVIPPLFFVYKYQVNLEYLGRVVFNTDGILYPDSVVGTDSHTTMIDGLGVAGWGVGGIEAEATMLGQVNLMWGHSSFNDRFLIITFFLFQGENCSSDIFPHPKFLNGLFTLCPFICLIIHGI